MKPSLQNEHGLTLIELLGAAVILSILILGILTITHYNQTSNYRTQTETDAMYVAERLLHEYRAAVAEAADEMAAWQALDKSGVWADDPRFSYATDAIPLADHDETSEEPIDREQAVSLPGIVLLDHEPWLVTVTVTWGPPDD